MRHSKYVIGFALLLAGQLLFTACRDDAASVPAQIEKVEQSRKAWEREQKRLESMRDSLEIKVAGNMELGMPPDRARRLETALIQSQEAIVQASKINYEAQEEVLKHLQGR